jgi:hypothetical protein
VICVSCRGQDHLGCASADCTCGHGESPVRPLTDAERQDVRAGRLAANVMPRETTDEPGVSR